jgi:hypothetical protein
MRTGYSMITAPMPVNGVLGSAAKWAARHSTRKWKVLNTEMIGKVP